MVVFIRMFERGYWNYTKDKKRILERKVGIDN